MIFGDGFVLFIGTVLWVWAVVDAFLTDATRVRSLQKTLWVLIILLFWVIGALLWIGLGRPRKASGAARPSRADTSSFGPAPSRRRQSPIAPDDDPEFLSRLGDDLRRKKPDKPDSSS